jgi:hypothetical protein
MCSPLTSNNALSLPIHPDRGTKNYTRGREQKLLAQFKRSKQINKYKKLRATLVPDASQTIYITSHPEASAPVRFKSSSQPPSFFSSAESSAVAVATPHVKECKHQSTKPSPFLKAQKEFASRQAAAQAERIAKEKAQREQQQQRQSAIDRRQSQRDDMRSRTKKGQPVMSRCPPQP